MQDYDSSDSNTTTSTTYVPSDKEIDWERELYRKKALSLETAYKKLQSENRLMKDELNNYKEKIDDLSKKVSKYSEINMILTEKLLSQSKSSMLTFLKICLV